MKNKIFSLCIIVASLSLISLSSATTYTVSKNGSGNFKTIQEAANMAIAGDTVEVMAGTYNERVVVKNNGSLGFPVKFITNGQVIITLSYQSMPQYSGLISIVGKQHIIIDGFRTIDGFNGIKVDKSNNITVKNNYIENTHSDGIKVGFNSGNNIIVEGNTVIRNTDPALHWYAEMISISNAHNSVIRNNHVLQNTEGEAIVIKDASTFVKVYDNFVEKSTVGIYAGGSSGSHDIEIYNNIATDNNVAPSKAGIIVANEMRNIPSIPPTKIYVHDNWASGQGIGFGFGNAPSPPAPYGTISIYDTVEFRNNKACNNRWDNYLFSNPTFIVNNLIDVNNLIPLQCTIPTWNYGTVIPSPSPTITTPKPTISPTPTPTITSPKPSPSPEITIPTLEPITNLINYIMVILSDIFQG